MYTDAFGNYTLPPSEYGYDSFILTGNATFVWPYNTDSSPYPVAKVMDFTCQAGNIVTLPNATEVSTGEDFLIRNVGANPLTVHNANGVQIATVAIGAASYFYLTDNTTAAGVYGVIGFGVGTSTVDAASLVGYGIKAVGASLNQAHPVFPTNTGITVGADHRAKLIVFTGGTGTFALTAAATLGDDYFTMFRNEGTGTATIDPASSELIDGMGSLQVQPGESLMLICTGAQWYSVGYGRSTLYQFTQLTKDVSAGGTITLTAAEASNKLITFIGNPTGAVNVVVPSIVAVYYTQSAISTAHTVTLKTAAGSGTGIDQGARIIALCDGTNVVSAQSAVANTSVSLTDGSAAVPSLYFATQTDTGLYKSGTQDLGVTVAGTSVGVFGSTGLQTTTIGANSTQRHALPAVSSDTVALLAATQTLTNKSVDLSSNTLTGTLAQFNTALTDGDFASLAGVETLTSKTISGASNTLTNIANASLTNSSITINGSTVTLGGSTTVTATATSALTIGTGLSGSSYNGSAPVTIAIDSTVATLTGAQTLTNKTITAPAISGGSINNTPIGGTTPAAGAFTTLSASGDVSTTLPGIASTTYWNSLYPGASNARARWKFTGTGDWRQTVTLQMTTAQSDSAPSDLAVFSPTGLSITGALSATDVVSGNSAVFNGDGSDTIGAGPTIQIRNVAATRSWATQLSASNNLDWWHLNGSWSKLATLDSSGNLGLGVPPSAWGSNYCAIEVSGAANVFGNTGDANFAGIGANLYHNNTNYLYRYSTLATMYLQDNGAHAWFTAPSGTAGNPITFTQAMTLDASGNLGLGVTPKPWSTAYRAVNLANGLGLAGSSNTGFITANAHYNTSSTFVYNIVGPATKYEMNYGAVGAHAWFTAPSGTAGDPITFSQAMTLDASGNLLVGTGSTAAIDANFFQMQVPAGALYQSHVSGTSSGAYFTGFLYGGSVIGSITQSGTTAVAYNTTSDHRLKENVRPANAARFMDIEFVDFEWVDGRHDCGVIAHQLQSVYPDLVLGEKDATEVRQVEIEPAVPAVTEEQLVTEAVLDDEGKEVTSAVYETVEVTPAVEAVTEEQTFPVYQQVNYIGLIGRMGTVIQKQQRMIEAMEARLAALEAA